MSDMQQWQLIPESECDDQDDYPGDEQIRCDIAGWEQEYAAWERNEMPLRATIFTEYGQQLKPEMMTREQHKARLAELDAVKPVEPASEAVTLLAQLLTWTGREAVTPEDAEQVKAIAPTRRNAAEASRGSGTRFKRHLSREFRINDGLIYGSPLL